MRRQILRASPAALRRAAEMFRPLGQRRPPIASTAKADGQIDLADAKPVEPKESNAASK